MNDDLGHYVVNNKKYFNKIQAILEAQKTLSDISWNFHSDIFDKTDWTTSPALSLESLYKLRAQQIRNEYDYVIVMCSGGADSTNVIKSFLNNGIHVDEVIGGGPISGLNNWDWNDKDKTVNNTISETKYALYPLLNEITTNFPNIKITFNDYFENILKYNTDEWLYNCQDWINPVVNAKGRLDKFKHIVELAEQGKRIAVVWGIDKPTMRYAQNGDIYTVLSDISINVADAPFDKNYPNVNRVLFYWSPDFPELMVKQVHILAEFAHRPENKWLRDLIKKIGALEHIWWRPDPGSLANTKLDNLHLVQNDFQRGIVPVIYNNTVETVFQCEKSTGTFMPLQHDWFYTLHKDTSIYQMIASDFSLFYKKINKKYLNKDASGFKIFFQKYKIGHYKNFMQ
jgi:hypothetical protein